MDEPAIQAEARALLAAARARRPRPWRRAWFDDAAMAWSLRDPVVQGALFRFAEALPGLTTPGLASDRWSAFLAPHADRLPEPMRVLVRGRGAALAGHLAHRAAAFAAGRFIAGASPPAALPRLRRLRAEGFAVTVDLLGETVLSPAEADAYLAANLALIAALTGDGWPRGPQDGIHPPVQVSVKLSALGGRVDPVAADAARAAIAPRLRTLLRAAQASGAGVCIDMEHHQLKELILGTSLTVLAEDEFRAWPHAALALQAYLRSAEGDIERVAAWARDRGTPIQVRLVKGAYADQERIWAAQAGWPVPTWRSKGATDACYERCLHLLARHAAHLHTAAATHNARSLAVARQALAAVPATAWEAQMLLGMNQPLAEAAREAGVRVRIYAPVGDLVAGMAYLVRRLLENTSNQSFVRAAVLDGRADAELTMPPDPSEPAPVAATGFRNQPLTDWSDAARRAAMAAAIAACREDDEPGGTAVRSPADGSYLGSVRWRPAAEAPAIMSELAAAAPAWRARPAAERAAILARAADLIVAQRDALAALIVHEVGKPWADADGDVCEAADFLRFYGAAMTELDRPQVRDVPGEANRTWYEGRGVAVVIAPWNFPLAIPAGMVGAALAAGCAVAFKPAEQSPLTARRLYRILLQAGVPEQVLAFCPGDGATLGDALVRDARTDAIAFTGSRAAGVAIQNAAAQTSEAAGRMKRVIAEMGGKNAVIVDADADADEAVAVVLRSAFGFQGQKCSACSRLVIVGPAWDRVVPRLVQAAAALRLAAPADPACDLGPLIDAESLARVRGVLAAADTRLHRALPTPGAPAPSPAAGHFLPAHIYLDVPPEDPLWRDELFAPVLAVARAADLDHAIALASAGSYALTGGLCARDPRSIAHATRAWRVGNLYINRPITGALVDRQPFGGLGLSGTGPKAGSADYLLPFLVQRSVSENQMRHALT